MKAALALVLGQSEEGQHERIVHEAALLTSFIPMIPRVALPHSFGISRAWQHKQRTLPA